MTSQNIPSPEIPVNPFLSESPPVVPSLVICGHSSTFSRKQLRSYHRVLSFMTEREAHGCQQLWVTLTTVKGDDSSKLADHHEEILRRVKRVYGYDVKAFKLYTHEGGGVIHGIWAIESKLAVWIDQKWISAEWEKIHGAKVVTVSRVGRGGRHRKGIAKYLVGKYLSHHTEGCHISWPWKSLSLPLGKAWVQYKRAVCSLKMRLNKRDFINGWNDILSKGFCEIRGPTDFMVMMNRIERVFVFVNGRDLDVGHEIKCVDYNL